jgi:hypothetical protein
VNSQNNNEINQKKRRKDLMADESEVFKGPDCVLQKEGLSV